MAAIVNERLSDVLAPELRGKDYHYTFVAASPLPEWVSPTWINGINKSESPAKAKPAKGRRKRASPETRDS